VCEIIKFESVLNLEIYDVMNSKITAMVVKIMGIMLLIDVS
jgi:hypothetical protein